MNGTASRLYLASCAAARSDCFALVACVTICTEDMLLPEVPTHQPRRQERVGWPRLGVSGTSKVLEVMPDLSVAHT